MGEEIAEEEDQTMEEDEDGQSKVDDFGHHRRAVPQYHYCPPGYKEKGKKISQHPDFLWSLSVNSKHLDKYLASVPQGIKEAAELHKVKLHPKDVEWLEDHKGRYQYFIHPRHKTAQKWLKPGAVKKYNAMTQEEIMESIERNLHTVIGPTPRFEIKDGKPHTQENYEGSGREAYHLLAMLKQYGCMLILLANAPDGHRCPAMKAENVIAYACMKFLRPNAPLRLSMDPEAGEQLKDLHGNPMRAEGTLQSYRALDNFFGAISAVHLKRGYGRSSLPDYGYAEQCPECFELFQKGSTDGCEHHFNNQKAMPRGNPVTSGKVRTFRAGLQEESIRRGYVVQSRTPFFPSDFKEDYHHRLFCHDGFHFLMELVPISALLSAVYTGGSRQDGFLDARISDLLECKDLFQIHAVYGIQSLNQKVKEKNDKDWSIYAIYFNDDEPKLCYLRHILTLIHCLRNYDDSSYLFPSPLLVQEMMSRGAQQSSEIFKYGTGIGSEWMRHWIKDASVQHKDFALLNLHSPRPTNYLWRMILGQHVIACIRNNRHRDIKTALKYVRDSELIAAAIRDDPEQRVKQNVGYFPDNLVHQGGETLKRLRQFDRHNVTVDSLKEVSELYVQKMLGVSRTHRDYYDAKRLLGISYTKKFSVRSLNDDPNTKIARALEGAAPAIQSAVLSCFDELLLQLKELQLSNQKHPNADEAKLSGMTSKGVMLVEEEPPDPPSLQSFISETKAPYTMLLPVQTKKNNVILYELSSFLTNNYGNKTSADQIEGAFLLFQELVHLGREKLATDGATTDAIETCWTAGSQCLARGHSTTFITRHLRHFVRCFRDHHNYNRESFQNAMPGYKSGMLRKQSTTGRVDQGDVIMCLKCRESGKLVAAETANKASRKKRKM